MPAIELCRLLAQRACGARPGAWALLRASRPAPADTRPTLRRRTGFSVAVATLITLHDEKKKSAAEGALKVFGPSTRGMRGSAGRYACRTPGGRAGSSVAVGGSRPTALSVAQLDRSVAAVGGGQRRTPALSKPRLGRSAAKPTRHARHEVLAPGPLGDSLTVEPRTLTPLV